MEKDIKKEVEEATKSLNQDAPFADVNAAAADMPEEVVKDL